MGLAPLIRDFDDADAAAVVALLEATRPDLVISPRGLLHRLRSAPPERRHRMLVAVEQDEVVGWCDAYLRSGQAPSGLIWPAVREDRRRHGIGAALFGAATQHLGRVDAFSSHSTSAAGRRFLVKRGFGAVASAEVSVVDPSRVADHPAADVVPLADVLDRVAELYRLHAGGVGEVYGAAVSPRDVDEWLARTLHDPDLSLAGSRVAIAEDGIAALAFLTVAGNRGSTELTATLPRLRGRGLAGAVKLATLRWAAANRIAAVFTSNYADNAPMLAVNRRLGYERIATSVDFRAPASA